MACHGESEQGTLVAGSENQGYLFSFPPRAGRYLLEQIGPQPLCRGARCGGDREDSNRAGDPGTAEGKVRSSSVNDPPAGSPWMATVSIPANAKVRNSFGELPGSPESSKFELKAEVR